VPDSNHILAVLYCPSKLNSPRKPRHPAHSMTSQSIISA